MEESLFNASYMQELKFVFPNSQRMNRGGQVSYLYMYNDIMINVSFSSLGCL